MKKTVLSIGVALMAITTAVQAETPATRSALNANIPQCLELYRNNDNTKVFFDCGSYVLRVNTEASYINKQFVTCSKNGDGSVGTCHDVWEN